MKLRDWATCVALMGTCVVGGVAAGCGGGSDGPPPSDDDGGTVTPPGQGPGGGGNDGGAHGLLSGPSHGSPIALAPDDSVAVMTNRDTGTVSVFALSFGADGNPPVVTKKAEVSVGPGSEPWQAVIAPDGDSAYVVLRRDQKVVQITGLHGNPAVGGAAAVGSEPTGIALTPTGKTAWVANWVDGTVSVVETASMTVTATIDLNTALVATELLGNVAPRAALAHPRSVAISHNGDANDDDEAVYVTEYYAQRTARETDNGSNSDVAKEGLVYKIAIRDKSVSTIALAPLSDMGFKDHNGASAGCYPNQLQSIAINQGYAYVTSICASPVGPIGVFTGPNPPACARGDVDCPGGAAGSCDLTKHVCKTNCTTDDVCGKNGGKCGATTPNVCAPNVADVKTTTAPVVSVIDLASGAEAHAATASLNALFVQAYTKLGTPDDASRRLPDVPADISFVPNSGVAYFAANGADAVFRVRYEGAGVAEVGAPNNSFIDLAPPGIAAAAAGKNPIGVAVSNAGRKFLFVANDVSRNLTAVDLNTQAIVGGAAAPVVTPSTGLPAPDSPEDHALRGKRFFGTGVGRWSLKGQAWGGCQNCHTDGLTDNVTWYFARGPRQSTSLDGTFNSKDPSDQRILNWTAIFDEISDFELNTRGISGGVGAIVSVNGAPPAVTDRIDIQTLGHAGLSGSAAQAADKSNPLELAAPSVLDDWSNITAYVQSVRSPRGATHLDAPKVAAGRQLFAVDGACQGCHGGDKWTISRRFYDPSLPTTNTLKTTAWVPPSGFPASLLPATTNRFMRFGGADPANFDQIQCILRPVGTFGVSDATSGVAELRANMTTPGQGAETDGKGFNPPSLLGTTIGAPFFHAGNAASLEAMFDAKTFAAHHRGGLAPNFLTDAEPLRSEKVAELVQFLLSIDEGTTPLAIPGPGPQGGDFCQSP